MAGWQGATYLSAQYVADGWLPKSSFVLPSISGGYLGADYLSARWVADGWLPKQPLVSPAGAWVNEKYVSRKYVSSTWLHFNIVSTGATITVPNVPGLLLAVLPGSARQTTRVNATEPGLALGPFTAAVNARTQVFQGNLLGLALVPFNGTANGSVYQVANVTFTVEVAATFRYTKSVTVQNVPGLATAAVAAIVTEGADVNVAATKAALPLAALATNARADSSTRAVASIGLPLQAYAAQIAVGKQIAVIGPALAAPLAVIPVAVTAPVNDQNHTLATVAPLLMAVYSVTVAATAAPAAPVRRGRVQFTRRIERIATLKRRDRVA